MKPGTALLLALAPLATAAVTASSTPTTTASPSPSYTPPTPPAFHFPPWHLHNLTIFAARINSSTLSWADVLVQDTTPNEHLTTRCSSIASIDAPYFNLTGTVHVPCSATGVTVEYSEGVVSVSRLYLHLNGTASVTAYGEARVQSPLATDPCGTLVQQLSLLVPVSSATTGY